MILTNLTPLLNAFDHLVGLYKGGFYAPNLDVRERVYQNSFSKIWKSFGSFLSVWNMIGL